MKSETALKNYGQYYAFVTLADGTPVFISAHGSGVIVKLSSLESSGRLFYMGNTHECAVLCTLFYRELGLRSKDGLDQYLYNELKLPDDMSRACAMVLAMVLSTETEAALDDFFKILKRKCSLCDQTGDITADGNHSPGTLTAQLLRDEFDE